MREIIVDNFASGGGVVTDCEHCKKRIPQIIEAVHANARSKGFWDNPREFGTLIALIHSELSEALEADRRGNKENIAEELTDVAIRLFDLCGGYDIDLEAAIVAKMAKNAGRPRLHGKAY